MKGKRARLIYGSTYLEGENSNFDLLWLIEMKLPDAHFFVEFGKTPEDMVLFTNSLEFTRAKKEAKNCRVELMENHVREGQNYFDGLASFLRTNGVSMIELHPLTPAGVMQKLTDAGFEVSVGKLPWYPARYIRTPKEIEQIAEVQATLERVFELVRARLAQAEIQDGVVTENGVVLTSEAMREFLEGELYRQGCGLIDTIVSSGIQAAAPHNVGSGPLRAHSPIIFDIFPYSRETGRFADMTRTLFKGRPDEQIIWMYEVVREAQELGIGMIRGGVDGAEVHKAIKDFFVKKGYHTVVSGDTSEGFIHGTGHSLNLWLHEPPGIGNASQILSPGMLLTVEPGLYYPRWEVGVRLEDMVVVEECCCRNLTRLPKDIKWAVIP